MLAGCLVVVVHTVSEVVDHCGSAADLRSVVLPRTSRLAKTPAVPELPEVEIAAQNVARWVRGHRIRSLEVCDAKLAVEPHRVEGAVVQDVRRRGKYVVFDLHGPHAGHLIIHFRMTGKLVQFDPDRRFGPRMILHFIDASSVAFEDARRLGEAWWVSSEDLHRFFEDRKLGPEPWPMHRDGAWWAGRLAGARGPIKATLMQQGRVAGLGNIAASEVCWLARIDPKASVPTLCARNYSAIAEAVSLFIERTIREESGPEVHYINQGGEGSFSVYGREGQECPRCAVPIARLVQSGRSTFHCPGCQLEPST